MKFFSLFSFILLGIVGCASNSIKIDSKNAWNDFETLKIIDSQKGNFQAIAGANKLVSNDVVSIDKEKIYRLKGDFKAVGTDAKVHFGLIYKNGNGQIIKSTQIANIPGTETIVTRDAKKGDTEIYVADAKKWVKSPRVIATNVKDDFSDLPNFATISNISNIEQITDNEWKISFSKPINLNLLQSCKVRQHASGAYNYAAGIIDVPADKWVTASGVISGYAVNGMPRQHFGAGVEQVQIVLLTNWSNKSDATILMRNISFEAVDPETLSAEEIELLEKK